MRPVARFGMVITMALCAGAATAAAQNRPQTDAPPPGAAVRIGFVNAQALLRGMPGYAQAESTYAKEAQAAEAEAQKLRSAWDSTVAQFQQSSAMMTPSNRSARERQLQAQADTLQTKLRAIEARVDAKERELLEPMQDRLRAVIDGVRAEGNYALIIDLGGQFAAGIVAYDKALDITVRVAQRLAGQSN
jgi:outer membrane protein